MEGEYLGLSIGGGLGSCNGKHNTPIYITNLWTGGCLAKTNQLMESIFGIIFDFCWFKKIIPVLISQMLLYNPS